MRTSWLVVVASALVLFACGGSSTSTVTALGTWDSDAGVVIGDGGVIDPTTLEPFSFFVTSLSAMQSLSGSANGFGGDLRFGETGDGAGLRGADKLCATIAENVMPGAGQKKWRAFLSTSSVDAIDRLGEGPWYDRLGRLVARDKSQLLADRPTGADAAIKNDLPNETGAPNSRPDGVSVDDHDTLTGSGTNGRLVSASATCADWTSTTASGKPRVGHAFPRDGATSGANANWISAHDAPGCAAGVDISSTSMGQGNTVGGGGGYGAIYCFAAVP
ncbi:MAG: hypothetical protein U0228_25125 [Myxococcaceae bacterium]